jgi:hypothetical protein
MSALFAIASVKDYQNIELAREKELLILSLSMRSVYFNLELAIDFIQSEKLAAGQRRIFHALLQLGWLGRRMEYARRDWYLILFKSTSFAYVSWILARLHGIMRKESDFPIDALIGLTQNCPSVVVSASQNNFASVLI